LPLLRKFQRRLHFQDKLSETTWNKPYHHNLNTKIEGSSKSVTSTNLHGVTFQNTLP
jgi:hypothetical protein